MTELRFVSVSVSAVVILCAILLSHVLTGMVRRHALSRGILDTPNERSSHTEPTPRGGGLAIAAVTLLGICLLGLSGVLPLRLAIGLGGGALLVATIGWIDDKDPVSPPARLAVHVAAAAWTVAWIGGIRVMQVGTWQVHVGLIAGSILTVLLLVWSCNLYNFMDGIDALAGGEAVTVGSAAGVLLLLFGKTDLALVAFLVAAASLGFLWWNWPPAKIFMGDVGSGLLGFVFGALGVASENAGGLPLVWWAVLFLPFLFDATVTLFRRALRRQKVYSAHKQHAYQRAVAHGHSHSQVTILILALNGLLSVFAVIGATRPRFAGPLIVLGFSAVAVGYLLVERRQPMS